MLASSWFDLVLGIDIHFELVPMPPAPAPVPLPIPNPFTGIVLDPMGLAAGLALSNAIGAVLGGPPKGPVLYWGVPATNTGTEAKHVPGHILIPPGTGWALFPKLPAPIVRPNAPPSVGVPAKPDNNAICIFGSKTVSVMGSNAVRLGDMLMSCSEPVRLPSSAVIAIPKGAPILIGGPPSLDIMAALTGAIRSPSMASGLHALVSRLPFSRLRNLAHRLVCFFTGHPVDVATGKVMTEAVDAELPGPLPLTIERIYSSAFASRSGMLGHGWSSSLEQAVWRERGKLVAQLDDGREAEFDAFDLPGHMALAGDKLWDPINQLTLRCLEGGRFELEGLDGVVRDFAPIPGRSGDRAMITRIRSRCGHHEIRFEYNARGLLEWVRDCGGRTIWLEHDAKGRLTKLKLPLPQERGWYDHRRYRYDDRGDLVEVIDSLGERWVSEFCPPFN